MRRLPLRAALAPLGVLLLAAQLSAPARGALFDDDEARRRIDGLKTRVDQIERTLADRLDALEAKSAGLADMFRDVEQIKNDIAKLRGQYEVLTYELEQAQKRQRDLYLDLDGRVRRLEGGPGTPGAPPNTGEPPSPARRRQDPARRPRLPPILRPSKRVTTRRSISSRAAISQAPSPASRRSSAAIRRAR